MTGIFHFPDATRIVRLPHTVDAETLLTKNIVPGCLIAAARHNRPTIVVYGGTIQPGIRRLDGAAAKKGDQINIGDIFEAFGTFDCSR